MPPDVFISYSSLDNDVACSILKQLEEAGLRCWFSPRDAPKGVPYGPPHEAAILKAPCFLLILSKHSSQSPEVHKEVVTATGDQGTRIMTFRIDASDIPSNMRFHLRPHTWYDGSVPDVESHLGPLVQDVLALFGRTSKPLSPTVPADCEYSENSTGEPFFLRVTGSQVNDQTLRSLTTYTDGKLTSIEKATALKALYLYDTSVGDGSLRIIGELRNLRTLRLERTLISDDGLRHLASLPQLDELWISGTSISDAGIRHLQSLPRLERLLVSDTQLTDDSVATFCEFKSLDEVHLERTQLTSVGLDKLKSVLNRVHY